MRGVTIRKIRVAHSDERRDILEIMNGELAIKTLKLLKVKKGEKLLGSHYHTYPEIMCIIKGSGKYRMRNLDTGEEEDYNLTEGDIVFRQGRIVHGGYFTEDSLILDGACEQYVNADFNDVFEKLYEENNG